MGPSKYHSQRGHTALLFLCHYNRPSSVALNYALVAQEISHSSNFEVLGSRVRYTIVKRIRLVIHRDNKVTKGIGG
jgi:hypothetical protein